MRHRKIISKRKTYSVPAYLKKQEKSQINHLTLHLSETEKESAKSKVTRRE